MRRRAFYVAAACLLGGAGGAGWAQKKPAAKAPTAKKPTLTAAQVLDRHIQSTGGKDAYEKIRSMVMTGKLEMRAQGLTGTFKTTAKAPNKILSVQTIEGVGETTQGFDGNVAWSKDPINGLRTSSGSESKVLELGAIDSAAKWRDLFKKVEMVGIRKVGNHETDAIRMTPDQAKPIVSYYDTKSFLLVRMDITVEGPTGTIPTESYVSDYRTVSGVKMPYLTRQRVAGIAEILLTVSDIKVNVPVDDSAFAKPKS